MTIAVLTDIHGNREAFEAVLAHARRRGAERFVFLGDFVGYGADPGFVVDTAAGMVEEGAVALLGNHDEAVLRSDAGMNPDAQAAIRWTRAQLDDGQRAFLAGLPLQRVDDDRLYVHANAWSPGRWGYVVGRAQAELSLGSTPHRVTFCGHVHAPALYHQTPGKPPCHFVPLAGEPIPLLPQRRWLAVVGAVGQPRDGNPAAAYALFDAETQMLRFERVPYDVEAAAEKIRRAGLPDRLSRRLFVGR
jgi:diadenosine tetraphosphatase ApaH/serine/threonine PP2A family protein phosphatase